MRDYQRIVNFDEWCNKCKHEKKSESDVPCDACLSEPVRYDGSSKPVEFEEVR